MATTAHTTQPHGKDAGHGGNFPPFDPSTFASQLLWLALAFGALYLILSKIALPRIGAILEERSDRIEADLSEAARLKTETETAIASYEKALADARANAQKIAGETRDALNAEADEARRSVERGLAGKLAAAELQIDKTKAAAMANVEAIATEAAASIVERLTGQSVGADAARAAVAAALKA
jgi:F-type H+-transporting ATPase subunit b